MFGLVKAGTPPIASVFDPNNHIKGGKKILPATEPFSKSLSKTSSSSLNPNPAIGNMLIEDVKEQLEFTTKLFLTQLNNQIPGNEADTDEMVRTIMGMMQTVQQVRTNILLEDGNSINSALYGAEIARFQGRLAEHSNPIFNFEGTSPQEFFIELPSGVEQANLLLTNGNERVKIIPIDPTPGRKSIRWDGTDEQGEKVLKGIYGATLLTQGSFGSNDKGRFTIKSPITSVHFDDMNHPTLMSGDLEIENIERIYKNPHTTLQPSADESV